MHNDHNAEALRKTQQIRHRLPQAVLEAFKEKRRLNDPFRWTEEHVEGVVRHVSRLRIRHQVSDWYKRRQRKPQTNRKHIRIPHIGDKPRPIIN